MRDVLFPTPPEPAPAAPIALPPRLQVRLIAVCAQSPPGPWAFVFDEAAQAHIRITPGESTASGARLTAVHADAATFDLAGARMTLELDP